MARTPQTIDPINWRGTRLVFFAMVLLLLGSCPAKSGIKLLTGIPVNTAQGVTKGNYSFSGKGLENCVHGDVADMEMAVSASSQTKSRVPAVLPAAILLLAAPYIHRHAIRPALYRNLKIPAPLPIFLQYRKLVI